MVRAMIYHSLQLQLQAMVNVQSKLGQFIEQSLRSNPRLPENGMSPFHGIVEVERNCRGCGAETKIWYQTSGQCSNFHRKMITKLAFRTLFRAKG